MEHESGQPRFRMWLRHKWETAEEWLPWFLGIASVLVLLVGVVVGLLRDDAPRNSTTIIEIVDDAESPKNPGESKSGSKSNRIRVKLNGDDSKSSDSAREPANASPFILVANDSPSREEITQRTGIPSNRARAVILIGDILRQPVGKKQTLEIPLFEDVKPVVQLNAVSEYEVNEGIRSGFAQDDENSRVQLITAEGMVSGFITYRGKKYQIVPDPSRGVHYIVEVKPE